MPLVEAAGVPQGSLCRTASCVEDPQVIRHEVKMHIFRLFCSFNKKLSIPFRPLTANRKTKLIYTYINIKASAILHVEAEDLVAVIY